MPVMGGLKDTILPALWAYRVSASSSAISREDGEVFGNGAVNKRRMAGGWSGVLVGGGRTSIMERI